MNNTFNALHLEAMVREVSSIPGVEVKRSRLYTKAVVMGIDGKKGAVIISGPSDLTDDRWLVHHFEDLTPQQLANLDVDFNQADDFHFTHWNDLIRHLKNVTF